MNIRAIIEHRRKCKWCGCPSPVKPGIPDSWIRITEISAQLLGWKKHCDLTFCCTSHYVYWDEQERRKRETQNEAKE